MAPEPQLEQNQRQERTMARTTSRARARHHQGFIRLMVEADRSLRFRFLSLMRKTMISRPMQASAPIPSKAPKTTTSGCSLPTAAGGMAHRR